MRIHLVVAKVQYIDGPVVPYRAFRNIEDAEAYIERHQDANRTVEYAIYSFEVD